MELSLPPGSPAQRYREWREASALSEAARSLELVGEMSEPEFQLRWFSGAYGRFLKTTEGESVEVVDFGRWNPEAGPTFVGCRLLFASGEREGEIEVRLDGGEWERNAAESADFDRVILHVFGGGGVTGLCRRETRRREGGMVAQVALDATEVRLRERPEPRSQAGLPLWEGLSAEEVAARLEAAAHYRLFVKADRLWKGVQRFGHQEALYQAVAETLGYRYNKLPFRLLTQRFPVAFLRRKHPSEIETLLFAGSGFLGATDLAAFPDDTQGYLRELWERWWPLRSSVDRLVLPAGLWNFKGVRPVNHPQRRVAALAILVANWPIVESLAPGGDPETLRGFFTRLRHRYWDHHYTLTSRASRGRMALIGPARATAMLANVFFPAVIPSGPEHWKTYRELPAPDSNERLARGLKRFFGTGGERWLRRMADQQGLLQWMDDLPSDPEAARAASRLTLFA
ncbi:MAG TPA: DUF2851 family protein [Chthoniobacteraceae bacterium]|nr:DUF2851 family protein [Chthoniobacteraceae bacterium]